jgi:hypothetical protein
VARLAAQAKLLQTPEPINPSHQLLLTPGPIKPLQPQTTLCEASEIKRPTVAYALSPSIATLALFLKQEDTARNCH